jgi:hypothetical protein
VNAPELIRTEDGDLVLDGLAPAFVHVLHELPDLLGDDQPDEVKDRLYPLPSGDEDTNEEWRRLVHPDLFALLASAREVILEDLAGFAPTGGPDAFLDGWRLEIPRRHINAWVSALNAGRLALGAAYELGEGDLNDEYVPEEWEERHVAVAKIHLLGWLQQLIIEDQHPPPDDADEELPDGM